MSDSANHSKKHPKTTDFKDALRDGIPVHISDVENGINCNCVCPSCEQPLIAYNNQNNKKAHHFQHQSLSSCSNYYETMIHYWAKEIINEHRKISVPNHIFELSDYARNYFYHERREKYPKEKTLAKEVEFDNILVEKYQNGIKPDLICFVKNKQIHIEIAVTHFIDEVKANKINDLNVTSLEIDLSSIDRSMQKEELRNILLSGSIEKMKWFNNKTTVQKQESKLLIHESIRQFIVNHVKEQKTYGKNNKIYKCPLKKSESSLSNCKGCRYLAYEKEETNVVDWENRKIYENITIGCIGHTSLQFDKLLETNGVEVSKNKIT
ncbi:hypothetical protein D3C87_232460 [compost metagenome]